MFQLKKSLLAAGIISSTLLTLPTHALEITFNYDPADFTGTDGAAAFAGFTEAATFWEDQFTDDVTLEFDIGFAPLASGALAQAGSNRLDYSYDVVYNALLGDATSGSDAQATSNLQCISFGSSCGFKFLEAETGSTTVDMDGSADNLGLYITSANAKALGLTEDMAEWGTFANADAQLTFSTEYVYDFDRSDGIEADAFDFTGIIIHEIGHALGFVSGLDLYDYYDYGPGVGSFDLDQYYIANTLDLFRYSEESLLDGALEFRTSAESYFSIDGGFTNLALFSTGRNSGDGQQASHWKDNLDIGAMDPTAARGEFVDVTEEFDLRAFDVIGWNLTTTVSEPGALALLSIGLFSMAARRRRRQS